MSSIVYDFQTARIAGNVKYKDNEIASEVPVELKFEDVAGQSNSVFNVVDTDGSGDFENNLGFEIGDAKFRKDVTYVAAAKVGNDSKSLFEGTNFKVIEGLITLISDVQTTSDEFTLTADVSSNDPIVEGDVIRQPIVPIILKYFNENNVVVHTENVDTDSAGHLEVTRRFSEIPELQNLNSVSVQASIREIKLSEKITITKTIETKTMKLYVDSSKLVMPDRTIGIGPGLFRDETVSATIDWGDGNTSEYNPAVINEHDYCSDESNYFDRVYVITITAQGGDIAISPIAFRNLSEGEGYITKAVFDDGINISLAGELFRGQRNLSNVVLPNDCESIPEGAFYECTGLTNLTIPFSVKALGGRAFKNSKIDSLTLQYGLETIGNECFYGAEVPRIYVPRTVTDIDLDAFRSEGSPKFGEIVFNWKESSEIIPYDDFGGINNVCAEDGPTIHVPVGTVDDYVSKGYPVCAKETYIGVINIRDNTNTNMIHELSYLSRESGYMHIQLVEEGANKWEEVHVQGIEISAVADKNAQLPSGITDENGRISTPMGSTNSGDLKLSLKSRSSDYEVISVKDYNFRDYWMCVVPGHNTDFTRWDYHGAVQGEDYSVEEINKLIKVHNLKAYSSGQATDYSKGLLVGMGAVYTPYFSLRALVRFQSEETADRKEILAIRNEISGMSSGMGLSALNELNAMYAGGYSVGRGNVAGRVIENTEDMSYDKRYSFLENNKWYELILKYDDVDQQGAGYCAVIDTDTGNIIAEKEFNTEFAKIPDILSLMLTRQICTAEIRGIWISNEDYFNNDRMYYTTRADVHSIVYNKDNLRVGDPVSFDLYLVYYETRTGVRPLYNTPFKIYQVDGIYGENPVEVYSGTTDSNGNKTGTFNLAKAGSKMHLKIQFGKTSQSSNPEMHFAQNYTIHTEDVTIGPAGDAPFVEDQHILDDGNDWIFTNEIDGSKFAGDIAEMCKSVQGEDVVISNAGVTIQSTDTEFTLVIDKSNVYNADRCYVRFSTIADTYVDSTNEFRVYKGTNITTSSEEII